MGKILRGLLASNGLFCVDYRTGSPVDIVGGLAYTVTGAPIITAGQGLITRPYPPKDNVGYGNNHNITDTTVQRSWVVRARCMLNNDAYAFEKFPASGVPGWAFKVSPGLGRWQFYFTNTWGGGDFISADIVSPRVVPGRWTTCAVTYNGNRTGAGVLGYIDGVFMANGAGAVPALLAANASPLSIGSQANGNNVGAVQVQVASLFNRVLTPLEIADLSEEIRSETPQGLLDTPRRNFFFQYPVLTPAQAVAQGLVLDTDFVRRSDGKVRNLAPTAYAGTLVGCPVPAREGEGMTFDGVDDRVDFGDITEMNSASKLTVSCWVRHKSIIANANIWSKALSITQRVGLQHSGTPGEMYVLCANGSNNYGNATALSIPLNVWQQWVYVYDGTGATNNDKLKLYIDGVEKVLSGFPQALPTTLANMAGRALMVARSDASAPYSDQTTRNLRVRAGVALTAAQVRAEYLEGAERLITDGRLRADGSCPVTLTTITTSGAKIPGTIWQGKNLPYMGAQVIETGGKRWIYNFNAGTSTRLWAADEGAFGSWYAEVQYENVFRLFVGCTSILGDGGTDPGYRIDSSGTQIRLINPGGGTLVTAVGEAYTKYRFWLSRTTASVWSLWVKGGAWAVWTLLGTATDATQTVGNFATATMYGSQVHLGDFLHFAGAMTPAEAIGLGLISA